MKRCTLCSVCFVFLLVFSTSKAFPADWHVDNAAGGSNDGTSWTDAWESFAVIDWAEVSPGDTIYISGGSSSKTYSDTLSIGASGSGSNVRITIRPGAAHPTLSSGHDGWVIIGSGATYGINYNGQDHITVNGNDGNGNRRIRVTATRDHGVYANGSDDIKLLYVHVYQSGDGSNDDNVRFTNVTGRSEIAYCDIEDPAQDGVKIVGHTQESDGFGNVIVHHNWIHAMNDDGVAGDGGFDFYDNTVGPWGGTGVVGHPDGMQVYCGNLRIYNNTFYSDQWHASNALVFLNYAFGDSGHDADNILVYNNVFFTSGDTYSGGHFYAIAIGAQGGSSSEDMDNVVIANNTIVDVGYVGIHASSSSQANFTNFVIKNNLVYNSKTDGGAGVLSFAGFSESGSSVDVDNNLINPGRDGQTGIGWLGRSYTVTEFNFVFDKGNITSAPVFVNYSAGAGTNNDLHLGTSDTAARAAGADLSVFFTIDKDGKFRRTWDIGAYEYSDGSQPPASPPDRLAPEPPSGLRIESNPR